MGQVVTFYSFKGGVGRTMTLANISLLLAQWGKKVLMVDWDLEAPGLEHYFKDFIDPASVADRQGVLDLLHAASENDPRHDAETWQSHVMPIPLLNYEGKLDFISSGRRRYDYFTRLRSLDVNSLYTEGGGGLMIEGIRSSWKEHYDYVLVDSRTGITDIGGICTIHLPDILVLFFTATEQSLAGVIDVANRASEERQKLPFDRLSLNCLPVPSRFDTLTEHLVAQEWLDRFTKDLQPMYAEWLPIKVDVRKFLETTKIPYVSYFSFGEKLAVRDQGTGDPAGLGYAYESVAALIGNDLANAGDLLRDRDRYLRSAAGSKLKIAADLANASEFALLLIEPYRTGPSTTMPSPGDAWSVGIEAQLARIVGLHGGDVRSSTDRYYVCQFVHITEALRSGLAMQERLAVNPIRYQGETATARMGLHGIRSGNAIPPTSLRDGIRTISLLLGNAKAGQLIVSEVIRERCTNETSWVRFKPAGTIEIDEDLGDPFLQTYEAIGVKQVQLNPQELEQLFEQDPASRGAGGFQNFLVKLQEKTNRSTGELELTISDLERIARLAFDYRHGGWQNQLRRIFGRVLGETLGRDV